MSSDTTTKFAVFLIVGLVVGAGASYLLFPQKIEIPGETVTVTVEVAPLAGKTIQIGTIGGSAEGMETMIPLYKEIMQPRYNAYLTLLGYDFEIDYLMDHASNTPAIHLEKTQAYHTLGVDVLQAGPNSPSTQSSLAYVNDNDMLMWSAAATSQLLAVPDDNLFRMCPSDAAQSAAVAEVITSWGIKAVAIIQKVDSFADGVINLMLPILEENGIAADPNWRIGYNPESREFSSDLATLESIVKDLVAEYGADRVGIFCVAADEAAVMFTQAEGFPTIYNEVQWFGADTTSHRQRLVDNAPEQAAHLRIPSPLPAQSDNVKFKEFEQTYEALTGQVVGGYTANAYDIGWVLLESFLASQGDDPLELIPLQAPISSWTFGASGWCILNDAGDRFGVDYNLWGYGNYEDGEAEHILYGIYRLASDTVEWDMVELGEPLLGP